jgi:hypothetical protein
VSRQRGIFRSSRLASARRGSSIASVASTLRRDDKCVKVDREARWTSSSETHVQRNKTTRGHRQFRGSHK